MSKHSLRDGRHFFLVYFAHVQTSRGAAEEVRHAYVSNDVTYSWNAITRLKHMAALALEPEETESSAQRGTEPTSGGRTCEVTVLGIKRSYRYTIPSFSAITLNLKHVCIRTDEDEGAVFLDVFFNEMPANFSVTVPMQARITSACIVDVSTLTGSQNTVYT